LTRYAVRYLWPPTLTEDWALALVRRQPLPPIVGGIVAL
jgi:hypothetical protein